MKWLILLALVASCGKHTQPAAQDIRDSDGDQIQNYQESELDKYVAETESLEAVKGVIRYFSNGQKTISFSNKFDLDARTLEMMTGNKDRFSPDEYFSEWTYARVDNPQVIEFSDLQQEVSIEFSTGSDTPDNVVLVNGEERLELGNWAPKMRINLSVKDLSELLKGNAHLIMEKKLKRKLNPSADTDKLIQDKTYRVYYNDGFINQVIYVSKELKFKKFLELKGLEKIIHIDEDDIFYGSRILDDSRWFARDLNNGDKVLTKTQMSYLRDNFLKRFSYSKKTIGRVNGKSYENLNVSVAPGAKVYLRINSISKTNRTFSLTEETRGGGGGGREGNAGGRCKIQRRVIQNEIIKYLHFNEFLNEFGPDLLKPSSIREISDQDGIYWEMKLDTSKMNSLVVIGSLPAASYTITGEIKSTCDYVGGTQLTNPEGKLSLEIESYVEKI